MPNFANKMKKTILLMMGLLVLFLTATAYAQSIEDADPFEITNFRVGELINITGVRCLDRNNSVCDNSVACNITMLNLTGDFIFINESMDIQPNGFRSFNTGINLTEETRLSGVIDCSNGGTTSFIVYLSLDEDEIDTHYWLFGTLIVNSIIFFILGKKKQKFIYGVFSGFILMLVGITIIMNGFPNIDNLTITEGAGSIFFGLGAWFVISYVEDFADLTEEFWRWEK